jgi:signal transduction histidine kinase
VCLTEVVQNIKLSLENKAKSVNVGLVIENKLPHGTKVFADKVALTHNVLANFVSNAIKFTPKGKNVVISLWQEETTVKIAVQDRGIGIPPSLLEKIFDTNAKSSRAGVHGEKGTGFGMPVAKFMLERFGGSLHISSRTKEQHHEQGTTVTVSLNACTDST